MFLNDIMNVQIEFTLQNRYPPKTRVNRQNKKTEPRTRSASRLSLVPVVGLEPTRYCYQRILSPSRLPFHHTGKNRHNQNCDRLKLYLFFQKKSIGFSFFLLCRRDHSPSPRICSATSRVTATHCANRGFRSIPCAISKSSRRYSVKSAGLLEESTPSRQLLNRAS